MEPGSTLPTRPRLADHAALRRHVVGGEERLFIRDLQSGELMELDGPRFEIVLCADGTRDLGGILLAAVRRGSYRRISDVVSLLSELHSRGLLGDGIEIGDPPRSADVLDRPLEVLGDYLLTCDANGTCCSTYDSVAFTNDDHDRARGLVPDVLSTGPDRSRGFLPLQGSVPLHALSVTMIDGRCPYLLGDGRCRIQTASTAEAKPLGCRIFPSTFVDDGVAVRVSVAVECPCVLASLGRDGGDPLVPTAAKVVGDLLPGSPVIHLPETIRVSDGYDASRAELREWSEQLEPLCRELDDPLAALWTLAEVVRDEGLSRSAAVSSMSKLSSPRPSELGLSIMMVSSALEAKLQAMLTWRPETDGTRLLLEWLVGGAKDLLDLGVVEEALHDGATCSDHESFYVRAAIFGHHLVRDGQTIEQALRARVTTILLARQLSKVVPEGCEDHPAVPHPLTVVELMRHSQGLDESAFRVGR